jgi:hypothetical protein
MASANGPTVVIRTEPSPGPNAVCDTAHRQGVLIADSVSGLGLADGGGGTVHVSWPFGYSARLDGDRLALVDPEGRIVAHAGDVVGTAGGLGVDNDWGVCPPTSITVQPAPTS